MAFGKGGYRYQAVIVGRESGNRCTLDFVRFRSEGAAIRWCARMNEAHHALFDLTYYTWEEIPAKRTAAGPPAPDGGTSPASR